MKSFFKTLFLLALVGVLVMMALGLGLFALVGDLSGLHVTINGDEVMWSGVDFGDVIGAGIGLLIGALVLCVVVPLALLLGLGLPLLIMGGVLAVGVLALLGVGAVLGSPILLVALVVWLLVRDRPRKTRVAPSAATAAGPSMT